MALAASTTALPNAVPEPETDIVDYVPTPEAAAIFNQTLPELEKRFNYGWVGSMATADRQCQGKWSTRPKIKGKCVKFDPLERRVKVSCLYPLLSLSLWLLMDFGAERGFAVFRS